jgi:poly(3-hydroxybutyrate) depolymerase
MSHSDYAIHEMTTGALRAAFSSVSVMTGFAAIQSRLMGFRTAAQEFDAVSQMCDRAFKTYDKPAFNLRRTRIGDQIVPVTEKAVLEKPYGNLLRFERDIERNDPKILLVAPMSGHYATLLRGTVEALLPHNDVYITDWTNVRNVPLRHGKFGLDEYETYVEDFINHLGPECHVVAVCQPTVPVLAAVAMKAARGDAIQPLSMTLMGGPIDTRVAPTKVTRFGEGHTIDWFRERIVTTVPVGYPGHGQSVHAGHNQLAGFIWMNPDRHVRSHQEMFDHLRRGEAESAERLKTFYDEYLAVMDIHGDFYLETVDKVFMRHLLPKGELILNNQIVNPSAIQKTALLTIEGEKDDISAPGQTKAAHFLCNNLSPERHFHYVQPGSGHYGIFEGRRWREEICPRVSSFIRQQGVDNGLKYSEIPENTRLIPPNFWQKFDAKVNASPALQK